MRRARDPQRPHPLLRSKEDDPEAGYRRPIPRIEMARNAAKLVAAAAAAIWFSVSAVDRCEFQTVHDVCGPTGSNVGTRLLVAVGATMIVTGAIDILYLRKNDIEFVFARNKNQQLLMRSAVLVVGVGVLVAGLTRLL